MPFDTAIEERGVDTLMEREYHSQTFFSSRRFLFGCGSGGGGDNSLFYAILIHSYNFFSFRWRNGRIVAALQFCDRFTLVFVWRRHSFKESIKCRLFRDEKIWYSRIIIASGVCNVINFINERRWWYGSEWASCHSDYHASVIYSIQWNREALGINFALNICHKWTMAWIRSNKFRNQNNQTFQWYRTPTAFNHLSHIQYPKHMELWFTESVLHYQPIA